jgi:hypothetical protein
LAKLEEVVENFDGTHSKQQLIAHHFGAKYTYGARCGPRGDYIKHLICQRRRDHYLLIFTEN